ncbi:hypothetical protein A4R35_00270 [Thermogemmatispora tikiterensis]|uniref:Uncharacterized protein n=1 Tax=Thermogemmatispora tikiterensis TaxID=1825093 RepID=A0A328VI30_9CHLR|nr:hypothetical protein A4R35_00270 [Thermogemmatispora tikiterensis]
MCIKSLSQEAKCSLIERCGDSEGNRKTLKQFVIGQVPCLKPCCCSNTLQGDLENLATLAVRSSTPMQGIPF